MSWTIYVLVDPFDGDTRYVGCTAMPSSRFWAHMSSGRVRNPDPKGKWIAEILSRGEKPRFYVLGVYDEPDVADAWEKCWMHRFWLAGCHLFNVQGLYPMKDWIDWYLKRPTEDWPRTEFLPHPGPTWWPPVRIPGLPRWELCEGRATGRVIQYEEVRER